MAFDIIHKAIIFSMGKISINWIIMEKNASYELGTTRINLCTIIDSRKPQITCNAMPRIPYALVVQKLWKSKCSICISFNISCFLWSLNNIFSKKHKFTILVINFKHCCVKVNANCRCHLKLLHLLSCNMNITTNNKKTWEG